MQQKEGINGHDYDEMFRFMNKQTEGKGNIPPRRIFLSYFAQKVTKKGVDV